MCLRYTFFCDDCSASIHATLLSEGTSGLWSQQQKLIAIEMQLYKSGEVSFIVSTLFLCAN
jgi:hypothetical protein